MIEENRRSRRLVARLGRGESLRNALESLARDRAVTTAWVSAHGVVARAVVETRVPMRPEGSSPRTVEGPFELASLIGDLASRDGVMHLDANVVLTRHADHGAVVVAGHLVDAEVEGVTVMIDCLDDLGLRREVERPTGLEGFRSANAPTRPAMPEPARPEPRVTLSRPAAALPSREPAPAAPVTPSAWAAVAAMSSGGAATPVSSTVEDPIADRGRRDEPEDYMPETGDWVDHRQFGLCRVDRATPDGELLIKLETGRRKEIRLDVLEVLAPRMDGARKIFPLRPRRR